MKHLIFGAATYSLATIALAANCVSRDSTPEKILFGLELIRNVITLPIQAIGVATDVQPALRIIPTTDCVFPRDQDATAADGAPAAPGQTAEEQLN